MTAGGVPRLPLGGFPSAPRTDAICLSPSSCAMMTLSIHLRRASLSNILLALVRGVPAPYQAASGGYQAYAMHGPGHLLRPAPGGVNQARCCNHHANPANATCMPLLPRPSEESERSEPSERAMRATVPKARHRSILYQCLIKETVGQVALVSLLPPKRAVALNKMLHM